MKRAWHPEELVEHWTILPGEWPLIEHKHGATRLGFAVLFKFFQYAGAFPRAPQDVPLTVVDHVAQQVGVPAGLWAQYAWEGRTIEYHRAQIRQHLGFREATVADGETLVTWLYEQIVPTTRRQTISKRPWYSVVVACASSPRPPSGWTASYDRRSSARTPA